MSLLGSTFGLSSLTRSRRVDSPRLRDAHAAAARQVEDARLARVGAEAVARGGVRLPTGCRPALARAARRRRRANPARAALSLALAIGETAWLGWPRGCRGGRCDAAGPRVAAPPGGVGTTFDSALSKQPSLAGSLATQFWVPAALVREKV